MFGAARTSRFSAVLFGAARALDGVAEVFGYQIASNGRVQTLAASGDRADIGSRTDAYVHRFHIQDPILLTRAWPNDGRGFVRRIQTLDIPAGDYRELCFERPGFSDKVTLGYRRQSSLMVLSFYRRRPSERASIQPLVALGQVAMAALNYHAGTAAFSVGPTIQDPGQILRERLARSFPALTARELEVVTQTLLGETASQIAAHLDIKPASVLTYRLRAYARFGYRQASDFLSSVLS